MAKINFTAGRIRDFKCPTDKKQAFLWDLVTEGLLPLNRMASELLDVLDLERSTSTTCKPCVKFHIAHVSARAKAIRKITTQLNAKYSFEQIEASNLSEVDPRVKTVFVWV